MSVKGTGRAVKWLQQADLLHELDLPLLEEIAQGGVIRDLGKGQILYSEGDPVVAVYLVARGSLKSIRNDADGREQVLSVEQPGMMLAIAALFTGGNYFCTAVAAEPSTVVCFRTTSIVHLCHRYPELLWCISSFLARRVEQLAELAAMLSLRNVDQRLALYLSTIAQDRGAALGDGYVFELRSTRPEIAARLGSVREVISRSFTHLQEHGLIVLRGRLINVPSLPSLRAFAGEREYAHQKAIGALSPEHLL